MAKTIEQVVARVAPEFASVREAETMTGISAWTWRRWAYRGVVASSKVSSRLLIPVAEIRRVMTEGLRPATSAL
ncbi:hypothetical protein [Candidatus Korobacter versatilis]|uniref:hypothetical protein n=1 Tax=Candidatus Korobacter versatilis TaxID=658062 RepID=UPI0005A44643|nr:hypothetical protein [Candidatus Koribacter versatilis]